MALRTALARMLYFGLHLIWQTLSKIEDMASHMQMAACDMTSVNVMNCGPNDVQRRPATPPEVADTCQRWPNNRQASGY